MSEFSFVLSGPQGSAKSKVAEQVAALLGCRHIVDEWDGVSALPPSTLALTNAQPCTVAVKHEIAAEPYERIFEGGTFKVEVLGTITRICGVAQASVRDLVKVLTWLSDELYSAKLTGSIPTWLSGELLDQFQQPERLVVATYSIAQKHPPMMFTGMMRPNHTVRFAPSPALARAYAQAQRARLERDLDALTDGTWSLREATGGQDV